MFFITVLKICQMYSFLIYPWKFKHIFKNLSFYPWLKAIFRKLLRCGCFPGNFPQYLRAALPSESYTSRWLLSIELCKVISFHYCSDFFLGSEEQGDYWSIILTGNFAAHLCFLKTVRFWKNFARKFVKLWAKRRLLWGTEKRCEVEWHTVKLWVLRYRNSPYSLKQITFLFKFQLDFIRFLENSLCFLSQHS